MKKRRSPGIPLLVYCLFLLVFGYSAYRFSLIQSDRIESESAYDTLRSRVTEQKHETEPVSEPNRSAEPVPKPTTESISSHQMDFSVLQQQNPDITAWLRCEEIGIDYPVLRGSDNAYYLTHLYNGQYNPGGSLFLDYRCSDVENNRNLVIYGHHMKTQSMFHSLTSYRSPSFYREHPSMQLYTPQSSYRIELLSGTVEDGGSFVPRLEFADDSDLISYAAGFLDRSDFQSDQSLAPGDRIVTLCTCSYEQDNARYVLIGKLVPVS